MAGSVISVALDAPPVGELACAVPDRDRLRSVVTAEHGFVWRSARRMGVPNDSVDDVTQHVFLVFCRRIHDIIPGQERSFLFGTVVRVASEFRKKALRRREVQVLDTDTPLPSPARGPEELVQMRQDRARLDSLLDELPTEQRVVFVLYELEELTLASIAALLGIPQGTVASRLRKARKCVESAAHEMVREGDAELSKEGRR